MNGNASSSSLRVLLVTANFEPHVGGIERFVATLAGGLTERGHRVDILCCRYRDAPTRDTLLGAPVHRIPSSYVLENMLNVPYPLPSPWRLVRSLRTLIGSADVVHANDAIYATSAASLVLARRARVPSVLTQHVAFVPQASRALDLTQRTAIATIGRTARLATIVASYNPSVAEWVRTAWAIDDARVVPVGVTAPSHAPGDRRELRRSFGLPEERLLALFVGRDVPKKGLDLFLAAADPSYHLVAVTDRLMKNADGVTMLPFMSPERLAELMSCVDVFVLPSEAEGIPLALQEALAAGLPVITTRQPGYELYLSTDDVLFVERSPADVRSALLRVTADPDLRSSLGERASDVAARYFGAAAFVTAYEELYREALGVSR